MPRVGIGAAMTTPVPSTSDPWPAANAGLLTRGLSAAAGGLCVPNMEQDMSSTTKQRGGGGTMWNQLKKRQDCHLVTVQHPDTLILVFSPVSFDSVLQM